MVINALAPSLSRSYPHGTWLRRRVTARWCRKACGRGSRATRSGSKMRI